MKVKEKREAYEAIETGYANIIIGTHALIPGQGKIQKSCIGGNRCSNIDLV